MPALRGEWVWDRGMDVSPSIVPQSSVVRPADWQCEMFHIANVYFGQRSALND
jgi:hypothetical protein